jgi:hypothetical protein
MNDRIDSLDFHPIAATQCDKCSQLSAARLDTEFGPLFFCLHHVRALFADATTNPRLTFAKVAL